MLLRYYRRLVGSKCAQHHAHLVGRYLNGALLFDGVGIVGIVGLRHSLLNEPLPVGRHHLNQRQLARLNIT